MQLTPDLASRFARTALGHVGREYPNKLDHVLEGDDDARTPRDLHPAFFGSFDWHSCVHSWWMLLRVLREFPDLPEAEAIRTLAAQTFTADKMQAELAYAQRPQSRGFERPYGWAWLMHLHAEAELQRHTLPHCADNLAPLAEHFAGGFTQYLDLLKYPITTGTHYNSAFALVLALQWAEQFDGTLRETILNWTMRQFGDVPVYAGWEPGGDEFLSPVLIVTQLMARILPRGDFASWFATVLPEGGWIESQCHPVSPSDVSDGKMAHLDGVNMSRAWCLTVIADTIPDSSRASAMRALAEKHFTASIDAVDGHYMSSHWLATFALLALLDRQTQQS